MPSWDTPMNAPPVEESAMEPDLDRMTRRLARVAELFHTVNYYTDEINGFVDDGFRGWWHAYLAYRPAPMGRVEPGPVVAAFYNFAPRMVERAIPGVWDIMSPEQVLARREELMGAALDRIFAADRFAADISESAELAGAAVADLDFGARPLSAGLADLDWPRRPALRLWHACTIWREYRGDSHNIALAGAAIDGVECHVLMAAAGHGNQPTIAGIRGWNEGEWMGAVDRLRTRGLVDADGGYTEDGERFRAELEDTTDRLSAGPAMNLGEDGCARLYGLLGGLTDHLRQTGEVAGVWPPPAVRR